MRKYLYKTSILFFTTLFFSGAYFANASITNGVIEGANHSAQVCENTLCTPTSTSEINFGYFNVNFDKNVHVLDTQLTGYIWGSSFGWVVLNCADTVSGCSGTNGNFKVSNISTATDPVGRLYGYAWGENTGWINFGVRSGDNVSFENSPTAPVTIDSDGKFSGYAWAQNFGWIKFDCSLASSCVKTDWRPVSVRIGGTGGSTGSGGSSGSTGSGGDTGTGSGGDTGAGDSGTGGDTGTGAGGDTGTGAGGDTGTGDSGTGGDTGAGGSDGGGSSSGGDSSGSGSSGGSGGVFLDFIGNGGNLIKKFGNEIIVKNLVPAFKATKKAVKDFVTAPVGEKVTQVVSTAGVVSGITVTVASSLFLNPLSLPELFLIPIRLWALLMAALGLKKRNRPWGTVYDSVTKQPLDPAYVTLLDSTGKEIANSITDIDGRYGFLIGPGTYSISAGKTNYKFPSEKLHGRTYDELYNDIYFGEPMTVTHEGEVIAKNIPLDPLKFDWNEFTKEKQHLTKFYSNRQKWLAYISDGMFALGFAVTLIAVFLAPRAYNIVTLALYLILFILKRTALRPKPQGSVVSKITNLPLSFAIIRVFSLATKHEVLHKITDKIGKYYCLIPNGTYYATIERKKSDGTYELVYTSNSIEITKGYLYTDFQI